MIISISMFSKVLVYFLFLANYSDFIDCRRLYSDGLVHLEVDGHA